MQAAQQSRIKVSFLATSANTGDGRRTTRLAAISAQHDAREISQGGRSPPPSPCRSRDERKEQFKTLVNSVLSRQCRGESPPLYRSLVECVTTGGCGCYDIVSLKVGNTDNDKKRNARLFAHSCLLSTSCLLTLVCSRTEQAPAGRAGRADGSGDVRARGGEGASFWRRRQHRAHAPIPRSRSSPRHRQQKQQVVSLVVGTPVAGAAVGDVGKHGQDTVNWCLRVPSGGCVVSPLPLPFLVFHHRPRKVGLRILVVHSLYFPSGLLWTKSSETKGRPYHRRLDHNIVITVGYQ